jgi:hypothetical protein
MQGDEDNYRLADVSLYEGNAEETWREAQAGGCSDSLWLRVAARDGIVVGKEMILPFDVEALRDSDFQR